MKTILTGIRPTGNLHLGHLFGAGQNWVKLQDDYDFYLEIADVQALTDNFNDPQKVRDNVDNIVKDLLSVGIDPKKVHIFIQSRIPEIAELTVFYSNLVTVARLQRNPTVKTDGELVPVGEDQEPLLEQCREIVRKFNNIYGNTLNEPEGMFTETKRVKGLDGNEKMGKSLGNAIFLVDNEETISKKIMNAVTDSNKIRKDDPADPDKCMVYYYHRLVNSDDNLKTICSECKKGSRGCVQCKKELIAKMNEFLDPIREKRKYYDEHPDEVKKILDEGTEAAREVAKEQMKKIKKAMMIDY